jgi:hypothetical protein
MISFGRFQIVLVGYNFGGLVIKSLVVEVQQRIHQRIIKLTNPTINKSCKRFLKNIKRTIFYSVPHIGGREGFLKKIKLEIPKIQYHEKEAENSFKPIEKFNIIQSTNGKTLKEL